MHHHWSRSNAGARVDRGRAERAHRVTARLGALSLGVALSLGAALVIAGCGAGPTPRTEAPRGPAEGGHTVIVLSLDGFRHDYPDRVSTPTFDQLAAQGAALGRLIPPWPSQTFPSHASLATGVTPGRHGIVNNAFVDRQRGPFRYGNTADWYDTPPLWTHATRSGVRTHVYHWVGSEGPWQGIEPAFWRPYDRETTDETKISTIIEWLNRPPPERPGLVMSYLRGCDGPGHRSGPDSEAVDQCIGAMDATLGALVTELTRLRGAEPGWRHTLLVVSDHGMMPTRGGLNVIPALMSAGVEAQVAATGPVAHVYLAATADLDAARAAVAGVPHSVVYTPESLPTAWGYRHPTRTGDLIVVAEPGYRFDEKLPVASMDLSAMSLGHHGHDPELPEMGAVFRAWGAGIKAGGRAPTARAVDLVPTVCHLLGIAPPSVVDGRPLDGQVIEGVLAR